MRNNEQFIHDHLDANRAVSEWAISGRDGHTTVIHAYSLDEFYPFRLASKFHRKECVEYEARQQYALPNTPKIILMTSKKQHEDDMLLLAQRGQFQFQKLAKHYQNSLRSQIEFALQIVTCAEMLHKKYGYFKFTRGMVRASKGPSLLVWINENEANNLPQFPIAPLCSISQPTQIVQGRDIKHPLDIMIQSLLQIISSKMPFAILCQLLSQNQNMLTFQYVKHALTKWLKQQASSLCSIYPSEPQKQRRMTQEKRRKMPQFLLNKFNIKNNQKDKSKTFQTQNKKSAITFSHHINSNGQKSNIIKKMGALKSQKQCSESTKSHLIKNIHESQNMHNEVRYNCMKIQQKPRFSQSHAEEHLVSHKKHEEKRIMVRDSGKSVSTSTANPFSITGSGNRFYSHHTSEAVSDEFSSNNIVRKYQRNSTSGISKRGASHLHQHQHNHEKDRSIFSREHQQRLQVKVSKIIQQNNQEAHVQSVSHSGRSPRNPSILHVMQNSCSITQHSIASPGSEFYKDIDMLLVSGPALSPQRPGSDEIQSLIEHELHHILFD